MPTTRSLRLALVLLLLCAPGARAVFAAPVRQSGLVVLQDTGQVRDGLHVFARHPNAEAIRSGLLRGFPARMVQLYHLEQVYLQRRQGSAIEPAYLEFSRRQGGFPGFGFWLDGEAKRSAGYVDLYEQKQPRPRFGGIDQIFPHELAHVMMQQLIGEMPDGGSTQGHAIAVRTDPVMAFVEGFAEHFQVMALDDPDADPGTRALLADPYWHARADREMEDYRHAVLSAWAPAARSRLLFMFWYSGEEQLYRYYGVKENLFARQPFVPERLLRTADPYSAYLLENSLPGRPADPPKSAAQILATEGAVSTLFWRWATSAALQGRYRDDAFYAGFGASRADVPAPLNVYLKLFHVFAATKPQTAQAFIAGYKATFPDEADAVDEVVNATLLGQPLPAAPPLWLANTEFRVGTRIFDQYRSAPRPHTFDLNAASLVDLVAVPGVSLELAREIRRRGPYADVNDLRLVSGLSTPVLARFRRMAADVKAVRATPDRPNSFMPLLWALGRRALGVWLVAAAAAAFLFKRLRGCGWGRASASGLGASFVTLVTAWTLDSTLLTVAAPLGLFAVPALLLSLRRRPRGAGAAAIAWSWLLAVAPALVLVTPLF